VVVTDTEFGRMGLTVCYDLRFPELYRALADRRADVITVPAAFTYHTGKDHWEVLLRARAIEDQAFVIAPAMWGEWGPPDQRRRCFGNSMAVDPWGRVLAKAPDGVGVTIAEVDLDVITDVRAQIPALKNRRLASTS
jgi:predicted amidohydrolase